MATLRDAKELLEYSTAEALAAIDAEVQDVAAIKLAIRYAAAISRHEGDIEVLNKLGPKLLATLESLGATPAARARMKDHKPADSNEGGLAKLRAVHRA